MTMSEFVELQAEVERLRAELENQAEIVTIEVRGDQIVSAVMKAPGLPDGVHDLFCAPCSAVEPAPEDGWREAIRDALSICRDLIDGKDIDKHFLRISIETILQEWSASPPSAWQPIDTLPGGMKYAARLSGVSSKSSGAR